MSTKAIKKELIAALIMTLVAMMALGSSTYAWFANNATVTANGMNVTVHSDVAYMMIMEGHHTAAEVQAANLQSASGTPTTAELYPVYHDTISSSSDAANMAKWYHQDADNPGSSTASAHSDKVYLNATGTDPDDYLLVNEFSITVASGSNAMSDLIVGKCAMQTDGDGAVGVLVCTDQGADEFTVATDTSGTVKLANSVTADSVVHVYVYVFWNGNDTDLYTNNMDDLKNTAVTLTFSANVVK